jgi:CRP-like cAMP-binding protein
MICSEIGLEDLVTFRSGIENCTFGHHATIFEVGTPVKAVHCIRAGAVKMVRREPSGGERIVRVLKKGDLAGLEPTFTSHHEAAAVAMGEVRACRIPISDFQGVVAKYAALQRRLYEKSQAALRESEIWLAEFVGGALPIRVRVARLLVHLRDGDANRIHRFCLDDMAAIIGSTRETVSRSIAEFTREGLLMKDGDSTDGPHFRGDIEALTMVGREGEGSLPGTTTIPGASRHPRMRVGRVATFNMDTMPLPGCGVLA